jgi:hypothetical protein
MLNYELFRKVVAPEYASMTNAELDLFASEAECEVSEKKWGCKYDRAVALITAHLIAMSERAKNSGTGSKGTGQVKKVKVGQLEREFDTGSNSESKNNGSYDLTIYGKEFIRIRKQLLKSPIFVSC